MRNLLQSETENVSQHSQRDEKSEEAPLDLDIAKSIEANNASQPPRTARPKVHAVPDEDLPSYREHMRSRLGTRFNELMDDLMPKLALASQKINTYTGTDYSGIAALRKEIAEQEQLVKSRSGAVKEAKELLEVARAKESSSRKEVVRLLERKHAWTDADLEQYMGLIRSEHANDQAVVAAKEEVAAMERELEEARTRLEQRERKQYHEEQIWSDTIRRNSTWITFVLMGVNILLLLSTTAFIEPWRRKRMVKEIKKALEEQHLLRTIPEVVPVTEKEVEKEMDQVIEPTGVPLEVVEETTFATVPQVEAPEDTISPSATPVEAVKMEETRLRTVEDTLMPTIEDPLLDTARISETTPETTILDQGKFGAEQIKHQIQDLFSDKPVTVRKVDVTAVALEGAAVGAALVGLISNKLHSRNRYQTINLNLDLKQTSNSTIPTLKMGLPVHTTEKPSTSETKETVKNTQTTSTPSTSSNTQSEAEKAADKLYDELIEAEYAKREGGA
ncbi:putative mitochondrion biogenesis protein [Venturia nashicola]|uniref:Sensitive to high expression protein 9, mitochondrial n=1 Tax=Venturia nashicola TaxID=86259 RepID=A0A4Z1P9J2_9PEZI|nr:putative mitochondrion biogenesis protein [Venturia nashicola]